MLFAVLLSLIAGAVLGFAVCAVISVGKEGDK